MFYQSATCCRKMGCSRNLWTQRVIWGSPKVYGFEVTCDRHRRVFDPALTVCPRQLHQRFVSTPSWPWPTPAIEFGPTVSRTSVERSDARPCFQPPGAVVGRATGLALLRPSIQSPSGARRLDVEPVSGAVRGGRVATNQRPPIGTVTDPGHGPRSVVGADRCHRSGGFLLRTQKKRTGRYSAQRAALGARTLKSGQSQFFVGYKKHTFRLWLRRYRRGVLLVPVISWIAPANYSEGQFLPPSVVYSQRCWQWHPSIVVADMG